MYDLARQMIRLGQATKLCTGVPSFLLESELRSIAKTRARTVVIERLVNRYAPGLRSHINLSDLTLSSFGKWVARKVGGADILDALAGTGLEAGAVMHRQGKPWLCNRGSSHVLTQKELLDFEHDRWNAPRVKFSARGIERALQEYESADGIVVPSTFNKRSFVANGINPAKVHVSPYGVDLKTFKPEPKQDATFRILFVGTASIQKGIGYLFEAVAPLVKRKTVEVWLVGSVGQESKAILDKYSDCFIYKGVQERSSLSHFYSQGSVLVLPSIQEGLALVQAQAMACGIPVIATENTGAEDLYTDGTEGFILPIRDPQAIREKIQFLLDCPADYEEMKAAASQRVRRIGGWDQYGATCLQIYRSVIAASRRLIN